MGHFSRAVMYLLQFRQISGHIFNFLNFLDLPHTYNKILCLKVALPFHVSETNFVSTQSYSFNLQFTAAAPPAIIQPASILIVSK